MSEHGTETTMQKWLVKLDDGKANSYGSMQSAADAVRTVLKTETPCEMWHWDEGEWKLYERFTPPTPRLRPARAFHDLNDVTTLVITGWRGEHEVKPHATGEHGVAIIAPRRYEDEYWTFQMVTLDGVLRCHSSLIGSPSLLTDPGEPMVILLPDNKVGAINVEFEA